MQAIILSVILTPIIAYRMYLERGAFTIGGEWLLPIVVMMLVVFYQKIKRGEHKC